MNNGNPADLLFVRASEGPSGEWNCGYAKTTALKALDATGEGGGIKMGELTCYTGPDTHGPFTASSYFFTCEDWFGSGLGLRTP